MKPFYTFLLFSLVCLESLYCGPCEQDHQKLCEGSSWQELSLKGFNFKGLGKNGGKLRCLSKHREELSPACLQHVQAKLKVRDQEKQHKRLMRQNRREEKGHFQQEANLQPSRDDARGSSTFLPSTFGEPEKPESLVRVPSSPIQQFDRHKIDEPDLESPITQQTGCTGWNWYRSECAPK